MDKVFPDMSQNLGPLVISQWNLQKFIYIREDFVQQNGDKYVISDFKNCFFISNRDPEEQKTQPGHQLGCYSWMGFCRNSLAFP